MTIINLVHGCIIVALFYISIIKSFTPIKKHVTSAHAEAMKNINFDEVKRDLKDLIESTKQGYTGNLNPMKYVMHWPPDYDTYAPLFIRLAWHASGSYRKSDGRGGADGGRQRFEPERSWPDNTNLDKARWLLRDIKSMYGQGLSWGDLIVLAGNAAIESLGGPEIIDFCGGRIDDFDGAESMWLGPSEKQEKYFPCKMPTGADNPSNSTNGACQAPLGSTTVGLIYVNPEGPLNLESGKNDPDPVGSAGEIRRTFSAMGMDDRETVALIGGGHTIGKTHGACKDGPGDAPNINPEDPWKGTCGEGENEGKLDFTFTSGFEFPWVTRPDTWTNEYFRNLINHKDDWVLIPRNETPGGKHEWKLKETIKNRPMARNPDFVKNKDSDKQHIGMLTSDMALIRDGSYRKFTDEFSKDEKEFNRAFEDAWYKLTTRDMGPWSRCINKDKGDVTPKQWQHNIDFNDNAMSLDVDEIDYIFVDLIDGKMEGQYARLAWHCMATFRSSDYLGGCNGGIVTTDDKMLQKAESALKKYRDEKLASKISMADLIILAGNIDIKEMGGNEMDMCYGRTDVSDKTDVSYRQSLIPNQILSIRANLDEDQENRKIKAHHLENFIDLMGLTLEEYSAIHGAGYAIGPGKNSDGDKCTGLFCFRDGGDGIRPLSGDRSAKLSNAFFKHITDTIHSWGKVPNDATGCHPSKNDSSLCMYDVDFQFLDSRNTKLHAIAERYAADEELFKENFANAWTKLASADLFDGPFKHKCEKEPTTSTPESSKTDQPDQPVTQTLQPGTRSDQEDKNCTCEQPVPCGSDNIKSINIVINVALIAIAFMYYF